MRNSLFLGHLLAFFTVLVWGSTFSVTKVLLEDFDAIEILFIRFFIAYWFLFVLHFRGIKWGGWRLEILFASAGLSGSCLYFLLENVALNYTSASNASLLVAISPLFTALLSALFLQKKIGRYFFIGAILAFVGVGLVVFRGEFSFHINAFGDILCLCAGLVWSVYTILMGRIFIVCKSQNALSITRKVFFYGLAFTLPFLLLHFYTGNGDFDKVLEGMQNLNNLTMLAFLGLLASALCYVSWNEALKHLGLIKASAYIYSVPVIGVIIAVLSLGESLNIFIVIGGFLVMKGLFLSQK